MTPVFTLMVMPAGSDPFDTAHDATGEPALDVKVCVKAAVVVALRLAVAAVVGATVVTVIELEAEAALAPPNAFVAVIVKLAVPDEVGVPLITPVEVLSDSPAGNEPAVIAKVKGPVPVGVMVWLYGKPVVAPGCAPLVSPGAVSDSIVTTVVLVPLAFETSMVKVSVAGVFGVPPMVLPAKVSQLGSVELEATANVQGVAPLVTSVAMSWLHAVPVGMM
jgi:hypothetical protein